MRLLIYLLMVCGAIGMVIGLVKDKQGYPWGRPLTIICVVVTLLLAVSTMMPDRSPQRIARQHIAQQEQYQEVIGEKIGNMLAEDFSGGHVLVIAASEDGGPYLKGLEQGGGDQLSFEVVTPDYQQFRQQMMQEADIPPEEMEAMEEFMMEDLEMLMSADLMDSTIARASQEPDAIVTTIGLPFNHTEMRLWRQRNHSPMIIASDMAHIVDMGDLTRRINRGQVAAMVMRKPDVGMELESIPRDVDEAFNQRYILVTRDNLENMMQQYPELLSRDF